jgi:hypothetical protein
MQRNYDELSRLSEPAPEFVRLTKRLVEEIRAQALKIAVDA